VAALEEAARLEPRNAAYPLELARLLVDLGLRLRARRFGEAACRLAPASPEAAALLRDLRS